MQIIVDKYAPADLKSALSIYKPDVAPLSGGSFYIRSDDDVILAVLVTDDKDHLYSKHDILCEMKQITEYVYLMVLINPGDIISQFQLLAVQEIGVFTLVSLSQDIKDNIRKLTDFISDPKRRSEKKILPARNTRFFTSGEQMILAVDGFGPEKLRVLLKHFDGSVAWALSALTRYDFLDDGLKDITARDISSFREAIHIEDNMILTLDSSEASHER